MQQLLEYIPIPFNLGPYGLLVLENQVSLSILLWSHIFPAIVGVIFSYFIYRQTKKLSALYLVLLTASFAIWSYLDLATWSGDAHTLMYTWSIMSLFNILVIAFTYWFLYTFTMDRDVPFWQKIVTLTPLGPTIYFILTNSHIHTYYNPEGIALEESFPILYGSAIETSMVIVLLVLATFTFAKATDQKKKRRAVLGGLGTVLFLAVFSFTFLITNFMISFEIGSTSEAYNISVYSLFGMPFLIVFLGYLVAKYQVFDLKLTKSIGMIVLLMLILFIGIFV